MSKKVSWLRVTAFVLIAIAFLALSRWSAKATVPGTAGQGYGAISVDPTTNNIAVGTSSALSTSVFTIKASSTITDSMKILDASGNVVYRFSGGDLVVGGNGIDTNYSITTAGGGIKAENSVAGQPAGYFNNTAGGPSLVTTGYVGIGATGPTSPLTITSPSAHLIPTVNITHNPANAGCAGCVNQGMQISALDAAGSGKTNIGLRIDVGNATYNYPALLMGGNVGINTTAPLYKLDVQGGQINTSGGLCIAGDCKTAWSQVTGTSYWTQNGTTIYYNGGNVGIGNTNPTMQLHLGTGGSKQGYIRLENSGSVSKEGNIYNDATNGGLHLDTNANGYPIQLDGSKVILGMTGNVGIGTANPSYKLDVSGNIRTTGTLYANANGSAYLCGGDDACLNDVNVANMVGIYGFQDSTKGGLRLGSAGADIYGSAGNVGVGTAAPAYKLDVNGIANATQYCIAGANCISAWPSGGGQWTTSGTNIYSANSGNVGIGTATPGAKLEINGDLKFTTANPNITASSYFIAPGGAYFSSGTVYTEAAIQARGGLHNDTGAYLNLAGGTSGNTRATGEVISTSANAFRMVQGNYGVFWRNDGATTYLLMTASGDQYGSWNGLRPIYFDNVSGNTNIGGNLTIGGGAGKLNVGTIDPIYNIDGVKYATYVAGMTGQKEETLGTLKFACVSGEKCSTAIDMANAPKASDLWLFSKATNMKKSMDSLNVFLTPSFDGTVWYKKDAASQKIMVFAKSNESGNLEVSYRLIAPRFDTDKWTNFADQSEKGLLITE